MIRRTFREAFSALRRTPLLAALSAGLIALAFFILGIFGTAAWNLDGALRSLEARVEVIAYLRDGVGEERVAALIEEIGDLPEVAEVRHVSRDDALRRAREEIPEFSDLFTDVEINPLPASLEISLSPEARTRIGVEAVAGEARARPEVEEAVWGQEWVDRLFTIRRIGGLGAAILGGAFALVAVLIIGTTIRIAVLSRAEEIRIMRLVGTRNGYIRAPFVVEGALTGGIGGLLALLLTLGAERAFSHFLFPIAPLPPSWGAIGVIAGVLLGMISGGVSVRRHLRDL